MNGLGGLNKAPAGVVIGLVQLQLPAIETRADVMRQAEKVAAMVGKAKRGLGTLDLVVFPEYALHGLSMDTRATRCCATSTGRRSPLIQGGVRRASRVGLLLHHGAQPRAPIAVQLVGMVDRRRRRPSQLYYRKMHPWVPGGAVGARCNLGRAGGRPGRTAARIALIICHDGMFPEMAREAAYKGAEIMLRTAGYTAPIRDVVAVHQPVQRLLQPDGDGERVHVRIGRHVRFDGRGDDLQLRRRA